MTKMEGIFTAEYHDDMYGTWSGVKLLIKIGSFDAGTEDLIATYDTDTGILNVSYVDADCDGAEEYWSGHTEHYKVPDEIRKQF